MKAFLEAVLDVFINHPANKKTQKSSGKEKTQEKITCPNTLRTIEKKDCGKNCKNKWKWIALFPWRIFFFVQHSFFSHVQDFG